ncbi:hypothetical protein AAC387_Pa01g4160 [Persea americana]
MEEEKAAAYYEELTRKGEGAARFKQGLGYSSSPSNPPPAASSSFLSSFVRASSPGSASKLQKEAQLHKIQSKLKKSKAIPSTTQSHESDRDLGHKHRHRSSREEEHSDREESSRRRRRDRDRDDRKSNSRRHRSCSSDEERSRRRRRRSRSRSSSPRPRRSERRDGRGGESRGERNATRENNGGIVDYSKLIPGYDEMTLPERVKAKMKLQLSQTAAKDTVKTTGWERFDFNKDAPLDDEEIEVAEDDAALVKNLDRSFRFSAVEAKREADIQAAHDQAIFGSSAASPVDSSPVAMQKVHAEESITKESEEPGRNLMSEKVISMQQGSWRDRASKLRRGSNG